jgi:ABC-type iron transport system FetAB permease component
MDVSGPTTTLDWMNVALGMSFVVFSVAMSTSAYFGLGIGRSVLTAAIRCILQLAVVALLLQQVFETKNPFAVAGIARRSGFRAFNITPCEDGGS